MIYFDACYIVRLYVQDPGWQAVRVLAQTDHVVCSLHGRAETAAAIHRKFRDGVIDRSELGILLHQFDQDCEAGFQWLPLSEEVVDRVAEVYGVLPASVHLRSADALHLASASCAGLKQIYSNDQHLLAAARHFGLAGVNVI